MENPEESANHSDEAEDQAHHLRGWRTHHVREYFLSHHINTHSVKIGIFGWRRWHKGIHDRLPPHDHESARYHQMQENLEHRRYVSRPVHFSRKIFTTRWC